ncbi:DUF4873 domain-containing protein [Nocardioides pocheonensis]|uniref:DUF4873 domain-containing protein n=1 Tax=Nocardioides pocheonensis TaxID=661485 RepID=A0A3N0GNK6_9ACTN|nr:DUF4873 domain-containing protein [Nocardioides pocheonensis]RNM13680.1 DUF4873 domain-containing protein [Nocardioides pocheonensis]
MEEQLPAEEYAGPAVVSPAEGDVVSRLAGARTSTTQEDVLPPATSLETTGVAVTVDVTLRGHFEPIDGRYHWYGRLAADEALGRWQPGTTVVLTTPHGSAAGRLSDLDPWGRYRISGTGRPPF